VAREPQITTVLEGQVQDLPSAPPIPDLQSFCISDLLTLFSGIIEELRQRNVTRSSNNPVADYAEYLCEKALTLHRAGNSTKGFDASDCDGARYQIKGRRLTRHSSFRQLGVLRDLDARPFDFLVGILFSEDFQVLKACLLPIEQVRANSEYIEHTNSWRFILRDNIWALPETKDISSLLAAVQKNES